MDPVAVAALVFGYLGQWAKAHPKIPAWTIDLAQLSIGLGLYVLANPPASDLNYWREAAMWAFALPGLASVAGHSGMAPKTT